jgi:acyl dehydratase
MRWDDVAVPQPLPEVVDQISYERVVMNAGTTWDYVPWHYNPQYAKDHGHPTIFVNTMHLAGFIDRIATDFGGPDSRVVRRTVSLLGSVYAGDSMVARGQVVGKRVDAARDAPRYLVDLEIGVFNQRDELCCPAKVTVELPVTRAS